MNHKKIAEPINGNSVLYTKKDFKVLLTWLPFVLLETFVTAVSSLNGENNDHLFPLRPNSFLINANSRPV